MAQYLKTFWLKKYLKLNVEGGDWNESMKSKDVPRLTKISNVKFNDK